MKCGKMPEKLSSCQSHIWNQHQNKALLQPTFQKPPMNQFCFHTLLKGLESLSYFSLEISCLDMDVVTSDIYIKHSKICYCALQQLGMMKKPLASDYSSGSSLVARPVLLKSSLRPSNIHTTSSSHRPILTLLTYKVVRSYCGDNS